MSNNFRLVLLALAVMVSSRGVAYVADALPGQNVQASPDQKAKVAYELPPHLQRPFVSTYYVQPKVKVGEPVRIGYYVTDWDHSLVRKGDKSRRFNVSVRMTCGDGNWVTKTAEDVPSGDGELVFDGLPVGWWDVAVVAYDRRSRLCSHTVWQQFRVTEKDHDEIPSDKIYRMTKDDLSAYGIRNDGDYGRLVLVDVPENEQLTPLWGQWAKLAEKGHEIVDRYLADHPHVSAVVRPGYAIYTPAKDGVPWKRAWTMCRVVPDKGYDAGKVLDEAEKTREGLQKLLDDRAKAGYRKFVFLPGTYRVAADRKDPRSCDVPTALSLPDRMIVDLNGATLKLNTCSVQRAAVVKILAKTDTVLENGTVEGDYFEHVYSVSDKGVQRNDEWVHGVIMRSCCRDCAVRNVNFRYVTGYGLENNCGYDGPGNWLTYGEKYFTEIHKVTTWGKGSLRPDGSVDEGDAFSATSGLVDIKDVLTCGWFQTFIYWPGEPICSRYVTLGWFDASNRCVQVEVAEIDRCMRIPEGATQVRVSMAAPSAENAAAQRLMFDCFKVPVNCVVRNCRFERCRAVGYAMAMCRNHLMEGNEFLRSGESLATCAFDAEDGGFKTQDVTIRNNWFHDNPNSELMVVYGLNMIVEGNRANISLRGPCCSPCVRSNTCDYATFNCRSRHLTGYARYSDNVYRKKLWLGGYGHPDLGWQVVMSDMTFSSAQYGTNFVVAAGRTGLFRNCRFEGVNNMVGNAENCQFVNTPCKWSFEPDFGGTWKNCTAVDSQVAMITSNIIYDHCRLKNFKTSSIGRVTYRDCELENCEPPTDCLSRAERQALEKAKRKASAEEKAKQDDLKKQKNNTKTK